MRRPVIATLLFPAFVAVAAAPAAPAAEGPELVILVRHAETEPDGTADPPLSRAGAARTARLASLLADARLTDVHSTPYRRTRGTAAAVGRTLGLETAEYDPRALPAEAERLLRLPGRHLVVGHSNTTPALVRLLGGDPGPPIDEDEHDRVYVLAPGPRGMRTLVLRY